MHIFLERFCMKGYFPIKYNFLIKLFSLLLILELVVAHRIAMLQPIDPIDQIFRKCSENNYNDCEY